MKIFVLSVMLCLILNTIWWCLSIKLKNVAIVDIFWSINFVALNIFYILNSNINLLSTHFVLFVLLQLWALRLSIYIFIRGYGKEEDWRYKQFRSEDPDNFWFKSLWKVFWLQGLLAIFINLPLYFVFYHLENLDFNLFVMLGVLLWIVGYFFESVGDFQLYKFKNDISNKSKVLKSGLWAYTRHPNYFGEFLIWWGFSLFAFSQPFGWLTIASPLLMSYLLLKVSGVKMLENGLKNTKPEYQEYVSSVPAFFPRIIRK